MYAGFIKSKNDSRITRRNRGLYDQGFKCSSCGCEIQAYNSVEMWDGYIYCEDCADDEMQDELTDDCEY